MQAYGINVTSLLLKKMAYAYLSEDFFKELFVLYLLQSPPHFCFQE